MWILENALHVKKLNERRWGLDSWVVYLILRLTVGTGIRWKISSDNMFNNKLKIALCNIVILTKSKKIFKLYYSSFTLLIRIQN